MNMHSPPPAAGYFDPRHNIREPDLVDTLFRMNVDARLARAHAPGTIIENGHHGLSVVLKPSAICPGAPVSEGIYSVFAEDWWTEWGKPTVLLSKEWPDQFAMESPGALYPQTVTPLSAAAAPPPSLRDRSAWLSYGKNHWEILAPICEGECDQMVAISFYDWSFRVPAPDEPRAWYSQWAWDVQLRPGISVRIKVNAKHPGQLL